MPDHAGDQKRSSLIFSQGSLPASLSNFLSSFPAMPSDPLSLRFEPIGEKPFVFADRAEAELLLALLNRAFLSSELLTEEQKDKLSFFCDDFQAFCLSL
jgi:hypothetical protein